MNILFINHCTGALSHGMEYRPYYLAREWVRAGHCVLIVAGVFACEDKLDAVGSMLPKVHEHMAAHGLDLRT